MPEPSGGEQMHRIKLLEVQSKVSYSVLSSSKSTWSSTGRFHTVLHTVHPFADKLCGDEDFLF